MAKSSENALVSWQAEEYIQREKPASWYIWFIVIGLGLIVTAVLLGWWSSAVLIIISMVALLVYSKRTPRILNYELNKEGLVEDKKLYKYEDFKSFGVTKEGKVFLIVLIPRKRFAPRVIVYFHEDKGEKIVDVLGARLPMQEVKDDFIDKISKLLRI